MSWVTIIWSMTASACLTLAAVNLLVWCKKRAAWANLLFSVTAVGTAGMAYCELWMMQAETPGQFGAALRWLHVPAWALLVALVGFVRLYLRAGRPWLAWSFIGLRTLSLLLDFLVGQNLNYREITRLRHIPFLSESVSVAEGVANPCMLVGQLSLLLLVLFVSDAAVTVWRRGNWRQALAVGGSIVFFTLAGTVQAVLVLWEVIHWPMTTSLFYLGIVSTMAYEMSREALRAAQLSDDLRESEERMTLASEAAGFGVWMWNIAGNQIWGSERWRGLLGFPPDATVTFENLIERIHPDDRELVEHAVRRAVADRSDYAAEYRVVLPDNTQHWVTARGRVYPDSHGKPFRMMGATIDISERKRSEEANRNAHELMAAVFNSVPGLLYLYTEDGQIVQWNKKHEELTGFTAEELLNRRARDWYDEEDLSTFDRAIRRIFSEGYADAEMKLIHKNGERVPYFLTGTKVMINGKPHLVGIAIDISVRKKAQELLRESEERMTLASEAAGFGVWMWSIAGNQVWGSERWLGLFGFPPDATITFENLIQRIHPDDREAVEHTVRHAVADRSDYAAEYRVVLPDNTQRWVAARGRVYPDTHGKPVRMMGATIDITARKQAELEVQQQRGELAHLSRVTMLGELSGSLAHELNQPLTAILSNAQAAQRFLAHDNADLNEVRDILADIVAEDKRAGEVIRRLRLLLKKGEVQHQPFNLNEVVREVLKLVRSDLVNQGVAAHADLAPALPEVTADRVQLQQVLLNLVMNACDAMAGGPAGDHKLIIRTELAGGEVIHVSVADRGVGLAPDNLEKVFEPFFTTKVQGMGLGLSVCRTIVTAHGGKLWAVNNPERGATFHFTLPASTEANP